MTTDLKSGEELPGPRGRRETRAPGKGSRSANSQKKHGDLLGGRGWRAWGKMERATGKGVQHPDGSAIQSQSWFLQTSTD